uniref:Uncharacterized protein n=1 Tax=Leishmania guyanensis TaxID=5670 RepID=A0A1E1J0H3_LEIGU|nr:Hypothetical protein BN36_2845750 [Leishmania guyanensis]
MVNMKMVDLSGNRFCRCVPSSWAGSASLQAAASGVNVSDVYAAEPVQWCAPHVLGGGRVTHYFCTCV